MHINTKDLGLDLNHADGVDPIRLYGYGIFTYFSLMNSFMILFTVLTIIHLPVMYKMSTYHENGRVNSLTAGILNWDVDSFYDLSFGNLGEATTKC